MLSKRLLAALVLCLIAKASFALDISMSEASDLRNMQDEEIRSSSPSAGNSMKGFYDTGASDDSAPAKGSKKAASAKNSDDDSSGEPSPGASKPMSSKGSQNGEAENTKRAASEKANDEIVAPITPEDMEYGGQRQAYPEILMQTMVSASDVNRFVCSSEIRDVIFSKEKGIKVKNTGKNLFVKFVFAKGMDGKPKYARNPVEIFVLCGDNTYNLILTPKGIPSQTVRLDSGKADKIRKNTALFQGMPFEKKVIALIKSVYKDEIADSFHVTKSEKKVLLFADLQTVIRRTIVVEGEGVLLTEVVAIPSKDMELTEKMFNRVELSKRPIAIAVETLRAKKGKALRVFLVEKTTENVEADTL